MRHRGRTGRWGALALVLVWGSAAGASAGPALVQLAFAAPTTGDARLMAECAELRVQLDRKTAEISALKRAAPRLGVREDYELRRRMAEANELARRLTALESELAQAHQASPAGQLPAPSAHQVPPVVEATAVLEARADLLSDEAHKLNERAAGLIRAAGQLRTRQTLRRRAATVERDPFASLDGSKRLLFVRGATQNPTNKGADGRAAAGSAESAGGAGAGGTSTTGGMPMPMPASSPGLTAPTAPPTSPPPSSTPDSPQQGPQPTAPPVPTTVSDSKAAAAPGGRSELAPGALLDPALRAELSQNDVGTPRAANDPAALEQAAAALVNRARALETQAKALRAQAASR